MDERIAQLVEKARRGDSESFGILYSEYFTPIYRFVYFKIRHKETAEDITQIVFTKAFGAVTTFQSTGAPFLSWLYSIAPHQCLDHWKKKQIFILGDSGSNGQSAWEEISEHKYLATSDSHNRER